MVEEKEETYLDTVKAAVEGQRTPIEPGPQIAAPKEEEKPKEELHDEGAAEEPLKAEPSKDESDRPAKDESKEPEKAVQDEVAKPDITRPPKRLPIRTKQRWLSIDPEVRADIWEREAAFDKAHARYDGLGQFAIKAERSGTTLQKALQSYDQMEIAMRTDPIRGAIQVWQAIGYDPNAIINDLIRQITPRGDQSQGGAQNPPPPPIQGSQGLSREEIDAELDRKLQAREIQSTIVAFEADPAHHYLEPLEEMGPVRRAMMAFLNGGLANNLQDAYDMAVRANGLTPVAPPNGSGNTGQAEKAAAVKSARQAGKATIGAPSHPPNASTKTPDDGNLNWIDTVKAAVNKQRG